MGEDPDAKLTYRECNTQGHDWQKPEVLWFRWGWRLPWVSRSMFKKCRGCGIVQFTGAHTWVWPKFRE